MQPGEVTPMTKLVDAVMTYYRENETAARRRILHNGETWKAEALRRIGEGITAPEALFNPDRKWRLNLKSRGEHA